MKEGKIIIQIVDNTTVMEVKNLSGKEACFHLIMALDRLAKQLSDEIDKEDKEAIQRWVEIVKNDSGNKNTDTTIN